MIPARVRHAAIWRALRRRYDQWREWVADHFDSLAVLAAVAFVISVASACTSSTTDGAHFHHGPGEAVVMLAIAPDADYPEVRDAVAWAADVWSQGSPHVEVRWRPSSWCASSEACGMIYLGTVAATYGGAAGMTSTGGAGGHIFTGEATWTQFDFAILGEWTVTDRRYVACHEIGHLLGLAHGTDGGVGPCHPNNPRPTETDLANIRTAYGGHG